MTWVQIDDAMDEHPKILALSHAAFRSHVEGLCFANRRLTDGFIPQTIGRRRGKRAADELVTAGVWDLAPGGFQIHDYADYQMSRAEVLALREKRSEAGKAGARARWGDGKPHSKRMAPAIADAWQTDALNPQSSIQQTLPRSNGVSSSQPIDHLKIRNTEGLTPSVVASIERLVDELTDATQGTVGRLIKLAQAGASQAHFEDARASIPIMNPKSPSRYACVVVSNHLAKNSAQETA